MNTAPGLIVNSLEIGKALAERNRAVLHARGMCMYPLVRPGDLLHIQSRSVEQTVIGDIAVCRREGQLVSHRIVDKGIMDGHPYIITRADRNKGDNDPFTYDEDLLGIVTCIERNGRPVNSYDTKPDGAGRFFLAVSRTFLELYYSWKGPFFDLISVVQHTAAYRTGSRLLWPASRRAVRYEVRVWKTSWRKLGLYMPLKPEEFDINGSTHPICPLNCWILALYLDAGQEPAAEAAFQSDSGRWQLGELRTRRRYRGIGLEKDLLSRAETIFNRCGITDLDLKRLPLE